MINNANTSFNWIGNKPKHEKQIAMLIPQYNEYSQFNMENRLDYFNSLAKKFKSSLDVIIIDDGSTDKSLEAMKSFVDREESFLYIASVYPNANKVGALYLTTLNIHHDFVITSDFDTDIDELKHFFQYLPKLKQDPLLMGGYFRMLPFEGSGSIFLFQQIEYSFLRGLYKFHAKELSVRVMPGAGSCYKREILIALFNEHSGCRNGEDRETTILGIKNGYRTFYMQDVLALTRPPLTFKKLLKQRIRWNLGYLETFAKEKKYYINQIFKFTRVGIITLSDILFVIYLLLSPILIVSSFIFSLNIFIILCTVILVGSLLWSFNLALISGTEYKELNRNLFKACIIFPFFKLIIECSAWIMAIYSYYKTRNSS